MNVAHIVKSVAAVTFVAAAAHQAISEHRSKKNQKQN